MVTGGLGQLGREIGRVLASSSVDCRALDLPEFDITRHDDVTRQIAEIRPDLVIHAAAFTKVDACENERETAFAVNAEATAHLACLCRQSGIPMVYISTDYVFDGAKRAPYRVNDPSYPPERVWPIQAAGRTRLGNRRRDGLGGPNLLALWDVRGELSPGHAGSGLARSPSAGRA